MHGERIKICDHTSVGVLVWKNDRLLVIERRRPPYGFAPPAGHVDGHGGFEEGARKELEEEVGLHTQSLRLLKEGRKQNQCRRPDGTWHYWKIYQAEACGNVRRSTLETKQAAWLTRPELEKLATRTRGYLQGNISNSEWEQAPGLEPVWLEWLSELGEISEDSIDRNK